MKRMYANGSLTAITVGLLLAGCGGSSTPGVTNGPTNGSATVGGTISGLPPGTTSLLVNNSSDTISVAGNGVFSFDKPVKAGAAYSVTLFGNPPGASCIVTNGSGSVDQNADAVSNIAVTCQNAAVAMPYFYVGATVSGLTAGNSVTFAINGTNPLTVNANGLAVFSQVLSTDQVGPQGPGSFNVTVSTNPAGQICTLTNASGSIGTSNFTDFVNVIAACT